MLFSWRRARDSLLTFVKQFTVISYLCFTKVFGQPLKTIGVYRFLNVLVRIPTQYFSSNKKRHHILVSSFVGGERGIRTPVGVNPNGFQDRLVMTTSIALHYLKRHISFQAFNILHYFRKKIKQIFTIFLNLHILLIQRLTDGIIL